MNGDAIYNVTQALHDLLQPVVGDLYVGPLDDRDAQNRPGVLFLYRVAINQDLRNRDHVTPPATPADPPVVHRGALPLDLYYLFTAGNAETGGELGALSVLGRAIQALNGTPLLAGAQVDGDPVRLTFDTVTSEEMSRVWALFPTANYRTSVVYLASPVWIDPATEDSEGAPVTSEAYPLSAPVGRGFAP